MTRVYHTLSALLLLLLLAGPTAAQRRPPARFAPSSSRATPAGVVQRAPRADDYSTPRLLLTGVAGGVAGAFLTVALTGGFDPEGEFVPRFLLGGALGFSIGASWYALTHSPAAGLHGRS